MKVLVEIKALKATSATCSVAVCSLPLIVERKNQFFQLSLDKKFLSVAELHITSAALEENESDSVFK